MFGTCPRGFTVPIGAGLRQSLGRAVSLLLIWLLVACVPALAGPPVADTPAGRAWSELERWPKHNQAWHRLRDFVRSDRSDPVAKALVDEYLTRLKTVVAAAPPEVDPHAREGFKKLEEAYGMLRSWPQITYLALWRDARTPVSRGLDYASQDFFWNGWDRLAPAQRAAFNRGVRDFSIEGMERIVALSSVKGDAGPRAGSQREPARTPRGGNPSESPVNALGVTVPAGGPFRRWASWGRGSYVIVDPQRGDDRWLEVYSTFDGLPVAELRLDHPSCTFATSGSGVFVLDPRAATLSRWDPITQVVEKVLESRMLKGARHFAMPREGPDWAAITLFVAAAKNHLQDDTLRTFVIDLSRRDTTFCFSWHPHRTKPSQRAHPEGPVRWRADGAVLVVDGSYPGRRSALLLDSQGKWRGRDPGDTRRKLRRVARALGPVGYFSPNLALSSHGGSGRRVSLVPEQLEVVPLDPRMSERSFGRAYGLFEDSDRYVLATKYGDSDGALYVFDLQTSGFGPRVAGWTGAASFREFSQKPPRQGGLAWLGPPARVLYFDGVKGCFTVSTFELED